MTDKKTCLVIDDSDVIREIAVRIVTDLGMSVEQSANPASAVEVCADHEISCVLLDWDLPSMGALDFLRDAADLPEDRRPVIIICATENDPQQFTLAKAAGAAHHVLKPFDRAAIETAFSEAGLIETAGAEPQVSAAAEK